MTAAAVCVGLLAGVRPGRNSDSLTLGAAFTTTVVLVNLMLVAVCILKGKLTVAMVGLFSPSLRSWEHSDWPKPTGLGRRRYQPESSRLRRSKSASARHTNGAGSVHDLIGGAPSPDQQPQPAGRPGQEQRP